LAVFAGSLVALAKNRDGGAVMENIKLAILGSTGSIGRQALEVVEHLNSEFGMAGGLVADSTDRPTACVEVVALAAYSSCEKLLGQARRFNVQHLALGCPEAATGEFGGGLAASNEHGGKPTNTDEPIPTGHDAVVALARLSEVDIVLNALVGSAGLRASYATLKSGKRLALANKESLVVGGDLLMPLAAPGQLLPVDSEHSAIYQCLQGEQHAEMRRIWLTASGGPFRGATRFDLAKATRDEALAHPNWSMGPKITVDSATLMNKGLEAIEAVHLFAADFDQVQPLIHPQSIIHSMVEFVDGSVKAHLGPTDMRIPIQYALSYPERWPAPLEPLDFRSCRDLSFGEPDYQTFGCLRLAMEAGRAGGTLPCVLNAANEVAVANFLKGRGALLDIEACVEAVLEAHTREDIQSIEHLEAVDTWARAKAWEYLAGKRFSK
jgi:1-deoxy-D-xylulose-5-phosphate reductoisomerase